MHYHRQHWLNQHLAVQTVPSNSVHGVSGTHTQTSTHTYTLSVMRNDELNLLISVLTAEALPTQGRLFVDCCRLLFLPLQCWKGKGRHGCRTFWLTNFRVSAIQRLSSDPNSKSQTETMQHVLTGEMLLALARQMLLHFSYEVYAAGMTALRLCPALQSNIVKWCQTQNGESCLSMGRSSAGDSQLQEGLSNAGINHPPARKVNSLRR